MQLNGGGVVKGEPYGLSAPRTPAGKISVQPQANTPVHAPEWPMLPLPQRLFNFIREELSLPPVPSVTDPAVGHIRSAPRTPHCTIPPRVQSVVMLYIAHDNTLARTPPSKLVLQKLLLHVRAAPPRGWHVSRQVLQQMIA